MKRHKKWYDNTRLATAIDKLQRDCKKKGIKIPQNDTIVGAKKSDARKHKKRIKRSRDK